MCNSSVKLVLEWDLTESHGWQCPVVKGTCEKMARYCTYCFQKAVTPTDCHRTVNKIPPNSLFPRKRFYFMSFRSKPVFTKFHNFLGSELAFEDSPGQFWGRDAPGAALWSSTTLGCKNRVQAFIFAVHCRKQEFCSLLRASRHTHVPCCISHPHKGHILLEGSKKLKNNLLNMVNMTPS